MKKYLMIFLTLGALICTAGCTGKKESNNEDVKDATGVAKNMEQQKDDVEDNKIKNDAVIMVVGDSKITYSEVVVYIKMLKQQYESTFTSKVWDFPVSDDKTFEDMAKDEIINQIARLKIMGFEAEDMDVSLNADEKLDIEDDAVKFLQGINMDDQKEYGINQNIVEKIYKDNCLAQKVFDVATADVDTNVSDDEATAVDVKYIKFVFNGTDRKGKTYSGSSQDKEEVRKKMDVLFDEVVTKGKDFDYYAKKYSDDECVEKSILCIDEDKIYEEARRLSDKQYSSIVEGKDAFYLMYCTNSKDTSNLEENKEKIIAKRQDDVFNDLYVKWLGKYDTFIVTDLWNMIHISEI